jgi:hypothetical protein
MLQKITSFSLVRISDQIYEISAMVKQQWVKKVEYIKKCRSHACINI